MTHKEPNQQRSAQSLCQRGPRGIARGWGHDFLESSKPCFKCENNTPVVQEAAQRISGWSDGYALGLLSVLAVSSIG